MRYKRLISTVTVATLLLSCTGCTVTSDLKQAVSRLIGHEVTVDDYETGPENSPVPSISPSPEPTWPPEGVQTEFVISMVGDCTLASSQLNNDFEKVINGDYTYPFSGTIDYFAKDDFTIANLECTFSDKWMQNVAYGTFFFLGKAAHANILVEGGVECVTMANNHTEDYGKRGIDDTHAALDAVGMKYVDNDSYQIYDINGMKLALYAINMPTAETIKAGIERLKANEHPDIIMAACHFGVEGKYNPTQTQKEAAHAAIDAGADFVIGSHPHVLQITEEYNGGYILYSLGNFSFGGNTNPRDKDSVIAQVVYELHPDGSYSRKEVRFIPISISGDAKGNDYRPVPYEEGSEGYNRVMSKLDGSFDGKDLVIDYSNMYQ